ncbi:C2 calcium-dependent membrane targeting [Artemisia annua]|uniref:C2 calcium-dependent membrane targeting n=1 Tax=Artemisia annua TaxID=35608 RepID=A0A2U1M679_ARTAN|nr:C2 calcium-dependent membrane targeting [Artemisia annua]
MAYQTIQGGLLEVTVVSCNKLRDTEWFSRQDPYVSIEYGSYRSSTRTCTDGGKSPTFQEKFVFSLIEGLRDINVSVWNSNTLTHDDYIGGGRIPLTKAFSQGFDDSSWPLQSKTGREVLVMKFKGVKFIVNQEGRGIICAYDRKLNFYRHAGEVRLIMHYSNANNPGAQKPSKGLAPQGAPSGSMYPAAPPSMYGAPPPGSMYPAPPPGSMYPSYPPNTSTYPPTPYPNQMPNYPPTPYPYGSQYPPGCHRIELPCFNSVVTTMIYLRNVGRITGLWGTEGLKHRFLRQCT